MEETPVERSGAEGSSITELKLEVPVKQRQRQNRGSAV